MFLTNLSCYRLLPAVLITALLALPALGQNSYREYPTAQQFQFEEIPQNIDKDERRALQDKNKAAKSAIKAGLDKVKAAMKGTGSFDSDEIKKYLDGYRFPQLTQEESLVDAGKTRDVFFRDFFPRSAPKSARVNFIKTAMPRLKRIAGDKNLSPAARINSVVIMAAFEDQALRSGSAAQPPQPSLESLDVLVAIYRGNQFPAYLRAAAFSGVIRHVQIDGAIRTPRISSEKTNALTTQVAKTWDQIIKSDPAFENDLNLWTMARSLEYMSGVRAPANQRVAFFDRMVALISYESKAPTWLKINAVRALSSLPTNGMDTAKVSSAVEQTSEFVAQVLIEEAEYIQNSVDELVFNNILYGDVDLAETGTDYSLDSGSGSNGRNSYEDSEFSGPRRGSAAKDEEVKATIELPTFQLNQIRRRVKLAIHTTRQWFGKDSLRRSVSPKHRSAIQNLDSVFAKIMNKTNVGIVDLAAEPALADGPGGGPGGAGSGTAGSAPKPAGSGSSQKEPGSECITCKLKEECERGGAEIANLVTNSMKSNAPGRNPGAGAQPRGGPPSGIPAAQPTASGAPPFAR